LSHHSKFQANKQVISVVLTAARMPTAHEQHTVFKIRS